ncbi:hypothetical protein PPYR_04604 [Photinus pyralis]|uniref:Uncharacterized protein n=1 Tax=Photinus pyralis TaxID=7054 RepID=A0A5N4AYU1_PHOPY|nr:uncharacterized protein LOC116165178 [Photinus pyralis]KAB0802418.1 hypothetical protein PPYR_04604 [Photinus pyralis]
MGCSSKIAVYVVVFMYLASWTTAKRNTALRQAYTALMRPALSFCICASDVELEMANCAVYKREFPNDACLKCFFKCVFTEICILNPDGTIDRDTLIRTVPGVDSDIADKCISTVDEETDLCEKMYDFAVCLDLEIFGQQ